MNVWGNLGGKEWKRIVCGIPTRTRTSSYALGGHCFIQLSDGDRGIDTIIDTVRYHSMRNISLRNNIYYYRRQIPKSIIHLSTIKRIYRPLSRDRQLALQLAKQYDNLFNRIEAGLGKLC